MMGFEGGRPVRCQRTHQPAHVILDIAPGCARPQIRPGPVHAVPFHLLFRGLTAIPVCADAEAFSTLDWFLIGEFGRLFHFSRFDNGDLRNDVFRLGNRGFLSRNNLMDSIRNRLFGDRDGRDGLGLRQQGLAGGDGEGNGLGAGRHGFEIPGRGRG